MRKSVLALRAEIADLQEFEDLVALRGLRAGDRSLAGAIVGRAIYEGRFGVDEALAAVT